MSKQTTPTVKTVESKLTHRIKKVAAYARVSTLQEAQEESYENQVAYYNAMIRVNPKWKYAGVYADKGISGTQAMKRPEFMRMVQDAEHGMIDLIYVKSISRFARNTMDAAKYVHELKAVGVEVVFEREGISSFDPSADMVFNLLAAMAQEESRSISENTRWAFVKKAEQGILHLGNNRILGYDQVGDKLVPNEDAWIVRLVFKEYAKGTAIKDIIHILHERGALTLTGKDTFDSGVLYIMLRNVKYAGDLLIQKKPPQNFLTKRPDRTKDYESFFIADDHEAIVDRETWNKVQERIKNLPPVSPKSKNKSHMMVGKIICHKCGGECYRSRNHGVMMWYCGNCKKGKCNAARGTREEKILEKIREKADGNPPDEELMRAVKRVHIAAGSTVAVEM